MQITGYVVRETEAAVAFVSNKNLIDPVRPLWVPKKKINSRMEQRTRASIHIVTVQDGMRIGTPTVMQIDEAWAVKIGICKPAE